MCPTLKKRGILLSTCLYVRPFLDGLFVAGYPIVLRATVLNICQLIRTLLFFDRIPKVTGFMTLDEKESIAL